MAEIGLFPLELVLLPTERVPLHVFEARYKELVGECLEAETEFGIILADDVGQRAIGTRAAVLKVLQVFDDGRLNIVVEGRERFRVVELTEGRSFATGEVEPLEDDLDPPEPEEIEHAVELFGQLVQVAEAGVDRPDPASESLSFELAARVDFGPELKQEILELRSERERLVRIAELLEHAVRGVALEKAVQERAAGNGRVTPQPRDPTS